MARHNGEQIAFSEISTRDEKLAQILRADRHQYWADKVLGIKKEEKNEINIYQNVSESTNKFIESVHNLVPAVPERVVRGILLGVGELVAGYAGYGLTDVLTFIRGINDLNESQNGRDLSQSSQKRAQIRGTIKIIGAISPVPSFYLPDFLDKHMPIPIIDKK